MGTVHGALGTVADIVLLPRFSSTVLRAREAQPTEAITTLFQQAVEDLRRVLDAEADPAAEALPVRLAERVRSGVHLYYSCIHRSQRNLMPNNMGPPHL